MILFLVLNVNGILVVDGMDGRYALTYDVEIVAMMKE